MLTSSIHMYFWKQRMRGHIIFCACRLHQCCREISLGSDEGRISNIMWTTISKNRIFAKNHNWTLRVWTLPKTGKKGSGWYAFLQGMQALNYCLMFLTSASSFVTTNGKLRHPPLNPPPKTPFPFHESYGMTERLFLRKHGAGSQKGSWPFILNATPL